MTELIKAFIIMQETSLKIDRDPETKVAVSVANVELSESRVILSMSLLPSKHESATYYAKFANKIEIRKQESSGATIGATTLV